MLLNFEYIFSFILNRYNANLGNTNNEQMAGGMAMSGRRLQPLEKLRAIRDRYRRKFDTKWQNVTNNNIGASPSLSTTSVPITVQREMEGKQ